MMAAFHDAIKRTCGRHSIKDVLIMNRKEIMTSNNCFNLRKGPKPTTHSRGTRKKKGSRQKREEELCTRQSSTEDFSKN